MSDRNKLLLIMILGSLSGCAPPVRVKLLPRGVANALLKAERIELFSLAPDQAKSDAGLPKYFHGYPVVGKIDIVEQVARQRVAEALIKGTEQGGSPTEPFQPGHGVRAVNGAAREDLIICFHCNQVEIHPSQADAQFLPISQSPKSLLDELLKSAGVRIVPEPPGG